MITNIKDILDKSVIEEMSDAEIKKEFSGNLFLMLSDDALDEIEENYFSFYCGPETTDGFCADYSCCTTWIKTMMSPIEEKHSIKFEADIAKNYHRFKSDNKISNPFFAEMWQDVLDILKSNFHSVVSANKESAKKHWDEIEKIMAMANQSFKRG